MLDDYDSDTEGAQHEGHMWPGLRVRIQGNEAEPYLNGCPGVLIKRASEEEWYVEVFILNFRKRETRVLQETLLIPDEGPQSALQPGVMSELNDTHTVPSPMSPSLPPTPPVQAGLGDVASTTRPKHASPAAPFTTGCRPVAPPFAGQKRSREQAELDAEAEALAAIREEEEAEKRQVRHRGHPEAKVDLSNVGGLAAKGGAPSRPNSLRDGSWEAPATAQGSAYARRQAFPPAPAWPGSASQEAPLAEAPGTATARSLSPPPPELPARPRRSPRLAQALGRSPEAYSARNSL